MSKEIETKLPVEQARIVMPLRGEIPRRPVPGWQWVKCDDCGTTWKESNRDVISSSHVDCPNHCDHGGDTHVWKYERDETLVRDTSGNLLNPEVVILARGLGQNAKVEALDQ